MRQTEVKFVVAESYDIVTRTIHNADDCLAFGNCADDVARYEVAARNGCCVVALVAELLTQCRQFGIAIDSTMYIVVVEHYDRLCRQVAYSFAWAVTAAAKKCGNEKSEDKIIVSHIFVYLHRGADVKGCISANIR